MFQIFYFFRQKLLSQLNPQLSRRFYMFLQRAQSIMT